MSRQDWANLNTALHEMAYQLMRPIAGLLWAQGVALQPWVTWRLERDAL